MSAVKSLLFKYTIKISGVLAIIFYKQIKISFPISKQVIFKKCPLSGQYVDICLISCKRMQKTCILLNLHFFWVECTGVFELYEHVHFHVYIYVWEIQKAFIYSKSMEGISKTFGKKRNCRFL